MELISYFALLHGVGVNVPAFDTVQSHNMHQKMIFSSCCFGKKKTSGPDVAMRHRFITQPGIAVLTIAVYFRLLLFGRIASASLIPSQQRK